MAEALFVSATDIKKNSALSGSVDVDKFIQYIKIAQQIHITNYIGTDLYNRLQEGIIAQDLNANEQILLNDYIQDALIHFATAEYLPFSAYNIANGGVFKHLSESSVSVDKTEVDYLVQKERDFAQYYVKRLVDYLCNNSDLYPEYSTNTDGDIRPSKKVNYSGNWYLGDASNDDLIKYRDLEL